MSNLSRHDTSALQFSCPQDLAVVSSLLFSYEHQCKSHQCLLLFVIIPSSETILCQAHFISLLHRHSRKRFQRGSPSATSVIVVFTYSYLCSFLFNIRLCYTSSIASCGMFIPTTVSPEIGKKEIQCNKQCHLPRRRSKHVTFTSTGVHKSLSTTEDCLSSRRTISVLAYVVHF